MPGSIAKIVRNIVPSSWVQALTPKPRKQSQASGVPHSVSPSSVTQVGPTGIKLDMSKLNVSELCYMFRKYRATNLLLAIDNLTRGEGQEHCLRVGDALYYDGEQDVAAAGDYHGNVPRFNLFLKKQGPYLLSGERDVVLLGDILHLEEKANLEDMWTSRDLLDAVIMLTILFPGRFHLVLGNHDLVCPYPEIVKEAVEFVFSNEDGGYYFEMNSYLVSKGVLPKEQTDLMYVAKPRGQVLIPQALIFLHSLCRELKIQGYKQDEVIEMVNQYQTFLNSCPMLGEVDGDKGLTYFAHSGVLKGDFTEAQLINVRKNSHLAYALLTNRALAFEVKTDENRKSAERLTTEDDFLKTVSIVGHERPVEEVHVLSGHDPDKNNFGFGWKPFPQRNFSVIHSNVKSSFGWAVIKNGVPIYEEATQEELVENNALDAA